MKLTHKIVFVVLGVTLMAIILFGSITALWSTKSFNSYLAQEKGAKEESLAEWAAIGYKSVGWDFVYSLRQSTGGRGMMMHRGLFSQERTLICDKTGTVYYDSEGILKQQSLESLLDATPIMVDGKTIGYVTIETPASSKIASLRQSFTKSLTKIFWVNGIIASVLAVAFGLILSFDLRKRIELLNEATTKLIEGDLCAEVQVIGDDELTNLAKAFNQMVKKLAANDRARQNLFNDVAHELRTPLSILRGNVEAMQFGVVETTPERIASLNDELIRLTSLVRELQEIGLAEAGELKLERTNEKLSEIFSDLQTIFEAELDAKDILLDLDFEDTSLMVDRNRLQQILINIISNALRVTPKNGKIRITVTEDENKAKYIFTVFNNGRHIDKADLEHIFDRFYKIDYSRTREKNGSGLGLSIAKAYVESHGGEIFARNIPSGVEFVFTIKKNLA